MTQKSLITPEYVVREGAMLKALLGERLGFLGKTRLMGWTAPDRTAS
jgi:hypothetical protein